MGRKRNQKKADQHDSSDDDSMSSTSTALSDTSITRTTEHVTSLKDDLEKCLDALYEKRGSTREAALARLVEAFEAHILHEFVQNKCITLLHQCINSIKRGSTREACLAARVIGLLAVTVGTGDNVHEILDETSMKLSPFIQLGTDSAKCTALIDCLALATFLGANDLEETDKAMKAFWEVIQPVARSDAGGVKKTAPALVAAAVSAWSFLLTTVVYERIQHNSWQESLPYLSNLLLKDDRAVRMASGEAIALIYELERSHGSSRLDNIRESLHDESPKPRGFTYLETLKGKILSQVRDLAAEAGGRGTGKKDLNSQRNLFQDILEYIEDSESPEVSVKISSKGAVLSVSTWTRLIQLNFLKRFLGKGFLKHMEENELLHEIFDFTPGRRGSLSSMEKRMFLSPNSVTNKERTQMRNKNRSLAQVRNEGHFSVVSDDL